VSRLKALKKPLKSSCSVESSSYIYCHNEKRGNLQKITTSKAPSRGKTTTQKEERKFNPQKISQLKRNSFFSLEFQLLIHYKGGFLAKKFNKV
jgi:hypothetical protein